MAHQSKRGKKIVSLVDRTKAYELKKAIKLDRGSSKPHTDKVGKLTRKQAEEIAKTKQPDLTAADLDAAVRTIAGSARSMGVEVEGI